MHEESAGREQGSVERPKVSVIIPVYNMEGCLEAGMESVREQNIEPLEIICIDDGSSDSSGEILARIAAEDSRVRVISQDNQGAGAARNAGLDVAQSEFVAFMDPDDCYPDPSTLQTLYWGAVFNDALICGGSFSEKFDGEITTEFGGAFAKYTFPEETFIDFHYYQFDYGYTRFLYNLDFLRENDISFPLYKRYQDPPFMAQALVTAGKFLAIPDITYQYNQHDYTKMTWSREQLDDNLRGMIHQLRFSAEHGFGDLHRLTYERFNKDFFDRIWALINKKNNSSEEAESTYELLREAESVLDVDLLNVSMNLNRSKYYLRALRKNAFDYSGDPCDVEVSVVLPAYNAEDCLGECLDSLREQTLQDFEIIIVDDGSWDSTPFIAEDAAAEDSRIHVVTCQEHTNAAYARNVGLKHAHGTYVLFFEADATAEPDMLEKTVSKAKGTNADIVMFGMGNHDISSDEKEGLPSALRMEEIPEEQPFSAKQVADKIFNLGAPTALTKLFKTDFVRRRRLRFQEISSCNDVFFSCSALSRANRIATCDEVLVYHKINIQKPLAEDIEYHTSNYFYALKVLRDDLISRRVYNRFEQSYVNWALDFSLGMMEIFGDTLFGHLIRQQIKLRDVRELDLYLRDEDFYYYPNRYNTFVKILSGETTNPLNPANQEAERPTPKVSIIIPTMNVEQYLRLCLDSAIYQTLEDIEIICINDGSTDSSLEIIEEYAERDSRIVVITGPNGGYGKAMNQGFDRATGEYIGIIEPDDFVDVRMFEALYERAIAENLDYVRSDFYRFTHDGKGQLALQYNKVAKTDDAYERLDCPCEDKRWLRNIMNTWSGIYRRDLIEEHGIRHHETPGASYQDNGFYFKINMHSERAMILPDAYYMNRRDNPNSSVKSTSKVYAVDKEFSLLYEYLEESGIKDQFIGEFYDRLIAGHLVTVDRIDRQYKQEYIHFMSEKLSDAVAKGEFKQSMIPAHVWTRIQRIINDPDKYYYDEVESQKKVSVVLPVYNQQQYLRPCIDSILSQSLKNFELICVDDGSTDHSLDILQDYANRDNRVVVIAQENGGAGAARNSGMKVASGEYLSFLDSDDWFDENLLLHTVERADRLNADICLYRTKLYDNVAGTFSNGDFRLNMKVTPNKDVFNRTDINANIFLWVNGTASDKLFRRSFIESHGLTFQEQRTTNDAYFAYAAVLKASRMTVLDERLYFERRNNPRSISNTRHLSWHCYYDALLKHKQNLVDMGIWDEYEADFVNYALANTLWNCQTLAEPARSDLIEKLNDSWGESLGITTLSPSLFEQKRNYTAFVKMMREVQEETSKLCSVIVLGNGRPSALRKTIDSLSQCDTDGVDFLCLVNSSNKGDATVAHTSGLGVVECESNNEMANLKDALDAVDSRFVLLLRAGDTLDAKALERILTSEDARLCDVILFDAQSQNSANTSDLRRIRDYQRTIPGEEYFDAATRFNDYRADYRTQLVERELLSSCCEWLLATGLSIESYAYVAKLLTNAWVVSVIRIPVVTVDSVLPFMEKTEAVQCDARTKLNALRDILVLTHSLPKCAERPKNASGRLITDLLASVRRHAGSNDVLEETAKILSSLGHEPDWVDLAVVLNQVAR